MKGLVKDIFWVFESKKTGKSYFQDIEGNDEIYQEFLSTQIKYNTFLLQNRKYSDNISTDFRDRFVVFDKINLLIKTDSEIVKLIRNNFYIKDYDLTFILYLFYYKLGYYDGSYTKNLVDRENGIKLYKLQKIFLYLKHVFNKKKSINKIHPITSLSFRSNGKSLLAETNPFYYNSVVPYEKFNKGLEVGIYSYSFSLYPTLPQPSGQLNFNILSEPTVVLKMDDRVLKENVSLFTVYKEYQILRIISGQASLSWT